MALNWIPQTVDAYAPRSQQKAAAARAAGRFASVVLRFMRELDVPEEKVNVNGGAIALGEALARLEALAPRRPPSTSWNTCSR
ncbi:acetyl-CoA acetyltransferase [Janthinobacterium sp. CG_23.3]